MATVQALTKAAGEQAYSGASVNGGILSLTRINGGVTTVSVGSGTGGGSATWYGQAGDPSSSLGNLNDWYINTTTGKIFKKVAGVPDPVWAVQINTIFGTPGATGATGAQGPAGPAGATGAQGPAGPAGSSGSLIGGGLTNEVLAKATNNSGEVYWRALGPLAAIATVGGTPSNTTYLRGDNTWATVPAGGNPTIKNNGTSIGSRAAINFVPGANISLSMSDDPTNNEVDVVISSTATGGGGSSSLDSAFPMTVTIPVTSPDSGTAPPAASTTAPYAMWVAPWDYTLTSISAYQVTPSATTDTTLDVHVGPLGSDISVLSTRVFIDATERTSQTASTGSVVDPARVNIAAGTIHWFYLDARGSDMRGAYVTILGTRNLGATPLNRPAAPTGLSLTRPSATSLSLTFAAPVNTGGSAITKYVVEISDTNTPITYVPVNGGGSASEVASTSALPFAITGLTAGVTYVVRVTPWNINGAGSPAVSQAIQAGGIPATPAAPTFTNVTATSMTVNWVAPSNGGLSITGYSLQRATNTGFTAGLTTVSVGNVTSYPVESLVSGVTYYFRVLATNIAGNGVYSATGTQATVTATVPTAAPTSLTTSEIDGGSITVNWTGVSAGNNGGTVITGYRVQRATNSGFTTGLDTVDVSGISAASRAMSGLSESTLYYFRVAAINSVGAGSYSSSVSATTTSGSGQVSAPTDVYIPYFIGMGGTLQWRNPTAMTGVGFDIEIKMSASSTYSRFFTNTLSTAGSTASALGTKSIDLYDGTIVNPETSSTYDVRIRSTKNSGTIVSSWVEILNVVNFEGGD